MQIIPAKLHRMYRILNPETNKALVVAMDHCGGGIFPGLEDFEGMLKKVIAAQPDGVMVNMAMVRHFNHLFKGKNAPGIVAAIDLNMLAEKLGPGMMEEGQNMMMSSIEEAVRYGVDCVKVLMTWGQVDLHLQHQAFSIVGQISEQCAKWNMPYMIEPNLWGQRVDKSLYKNNKMLGDTARIAAEMGADILKIDFSGDIKAYAEVVKASIVPVFLLGGAKEGSFKPFMEKLAGAMQAGCAGAVIGRSIWQAKDINKMVEACKLAVHKNDVDGAMKLAEKAY